MNRIPSWAVVGLVAFIVGVSLGELHRQWMGEIRWGEVAFFAVIAAVVLGVAVWMKSRPPSQG